MKCIYDRPGYTMPTCHDCVDTVGDGRHCTSGCVEDLLEEIEKLRDENRMLRLQEIRDGRAIRALKRTVRLLCNKRDERVGVEDIDEILKDVRQRADVAARQDGDATVHHSAVAAMLIDIADRFAAAFNRFCESKRSFYCTNTDCPLKKALSEMKGSGEA